jgi:hypothetical protein
MDMKHENNYHLPWHWKTLRAVVSLLCVENGHDCVNHVFNAYDRVAQVDGRYVHWVHTWDKGDRYGLIFYDTSDQKQHLFGSGR